MANRHLRTKHEPSEGLASAGLPEHAARFLPELDEPGLLGQLEGPLYPDYSWGATCRRDVFRKTRDKE